MAMKRHKERIKHSPVKLRKSWNMSQPKKGSLLNWAVYFKHSSLCLAISVYIVCGIQLFLR